MIFLHTFAYTSPTVCCSLHLPPACRGLLFVLTSYFTQNKAMTQPCHKRKTKVVHKRLVFITMKSYQKFDGCVNLKSKTPVLTSFLQISVQQISCYVDRRWICCLSCCFINSMILEFSKQYSAFRKSAHSNIIYISKFAWHILPSEQKMHNEQLSVTLQILFLLSSLSKHCILLFCRFCKSADLFP